MIYATTPIRVNQLPQANVGVMASGEILMTLDTSRVIIGHDPNQGNPNYNRSEFPFANQEVLTESTEKVNELFGLYYRNMDEWDSYHPAVIANGAGYVPIMAAEEDGGLAAQYILEGVHVSAAVEYHAYSDAGPLRSGMLRVLASPTSITVSDTPVGNSSITGTTLSFQVVSTEGGYLVRANNTGAEPVSLRLKRTVISV